MCGRGACTLGKKEYVTAVCKKLGRGAGADGGPAVTFPQVDSFGPNFNVAPGQLYPILRQKDGAFELDLMRFGFDAPFKGGSGGLVINARSETVHEKGLFKKHLHEERCVVFFSGFFEWHKKGGVKQPFFVQDADGDELLAMAAIYKINKAGEGCFTILTTQVCKEFAWCHDRMPVILETEEAIWGWLQCSERTFAQCRGLLKSTNRIKWYMVTPAMGNVKMNNSHCVERISGEPQPSLSPRKPRTKASGKLSPSLSPRSLPTSPSQSPDRPFSLPPATDEDLAMLSKQFQDEYMADPTELLLKCTQPHKPKKRSADDAEQTAKKPRMK